MRAPPVDGKLVDSGGVGHVVQEHHDGGRSGSARAYIEERPSDGYGAMNDRESMKVMIER